MRKVATYRDHDIYEQETLWTIVWVIKGPIINDTIPYGFLPKLEYVKEHIDMILDEVEDQ